MDRQRDGFNCWNSRNYLNWPGHRFIQCDLTIHRVLVSRRLCNSAIVMDDCVFFFRTFRKTVQFYCFRLKTETSCKLSIKLQTQNCNENGVVQFNLHFKWHVEWCCFMPESHFWLWWHFSSILYFLFRSWNLHRISPFAIVQKEFNGN